MFDTGCASFASFHVHLRSFPCIYCIVHPDCAEAYAKLGCTHKQNDGFFLCDLACILSLLDNCQAKFNHVRRNCNPRHYVQPIFF